MFKSDRTTCIHYIQTNGYKAFAEEMPRRKAQTMRRDNNMKADYTDTYNTTVRSTSSITAKDLFQQTFVHYPKPVLYLFRIRDRLVKPVGLQSGGRFTDFVTEQNDSRAIIYKSDKHLDFRILL